MVSTGITIGALSRATGIPAPTLRTWERRYGWPKPLRTAGGQRLYDAADIERLRLIALAMERGHRAKQVLEADLATLRDMTGRSVAPELLGTALWISQIERSDFVALESSLRGVLAARGLRAFVDVAGELIVAIGDGWSKGHLEVYQEHAASAVIESILVESWRALAARNDGPVMALGTLPQERHGLGLHLVAAIAALSGRRVFFLGVDLPLESLADSVRDTEARDLVLSVSSARVGDAGQDLRALVALLPGFRIAVGGAGAPDVPGVHRPQGFSALADWLASA